MDADAIIPEGGKLGRIINSRSAQASQGDCRKETSMQQLTEFRGGETDCPALKEQRGHPLTHFEKAFTPSNSNATYCQPPASDVCILIKSHAAGEK